MAIDHGPSRMAACGSRPGTWEGTGLEGAAIQHDPIAFGVPPGSRLRTNPGVRLAWSSHLKSAVKKNGSFMVLLDSGSGENLRAEFADEGVVVAQVYEQMPLQYGEGGR